MSSIGHVCAMVDEDAPAKPRLKKDMRVRVVVPGVDAVVTIKTIHGDRAVIRDDDGNLWNAAVDCLEPIEETGEAA